MAATIETVVDSRSHREAAVLRTTRTAAKLLRRLAPPLLFLSSAGGCQADISGGEAAVGAAPATGGSASAGSSGVATGGSAGGVTQPPVDIGDVVGVDPTTLPDGVPGNSRALRLAYREYDRTVSQLLHLAVDSSRNFPEEQPGLGPYVGYAGLTVNERLYNELTKGASALAERVVSDPTAYAAVVGCAPADTGCRAQFIDGFGLRAFRRPLTASEQTRYQTLFDRGAELVASGNAFRDGVQLVIEAILQSPKFLYRIEAGSGEMDAQGPLLTPYEVATRLSFMLAGRAPDAALLDAARSGALLQTSGIVEQAKRLAASAEFGDRVMSFHEAWMQLEELGSLTKDTATFPSFSPDLVASMRGEAERFIRTVTLEENGTVSALLTAPFGFADQRLAALYSLSGNFGAELQRFEQPAGSRRAGLFTQAAFLAGHSSSSSGTSPILRGVFLLRRVACADIPDPPANAQMQEPTTPAGELKTTRDYFAWKTSMPACVGCHTLINPTGFSFENFDGLGQWRDTERGAPIDSSGTLVLNGRTLPFTNAAELLKGLAEDPQVRACYAKNWLQFAYGRREGQEDLRALGLATRELGTAGYSIRDLAVALTERPAFNHLSPLSE